MPATERTYTHEEIGGHLRDLAAHCGEPDKARYLGMAATYDRDPTDLVGGSRRAITESRALLADVDRLLR